MPEKFTASLIIKTTAGKSPRDTISRELDGIIHLSKHPLEIRGENLLEYILERSRVAGEHEFVITCEEAGNG